MIVVVISGRGAWWCALNDSYRWIRRFDNKIHCFTWKSITVDSKQSSLCLSPIAEHRVAPGWLRACDQNDLFSVRASFVMLTLAVSRHSTGFTWVWTITYPVLCAWALGASLYIFVYRICFRPVQTLVCQTLDVYMLGWCVFPFYQWDWL